MSRIDGVSNSGAIQRITAQPILREASPGPGSVSRPSDRLELSGMSHLLQTLKAQEIRTDKVAAIRAQLESGTYEDEYKMDVAVDRLLDDLNR